LLHEVLQAQSWSIAGAGFAIVLGLGLCIYTVLSMRLTVKLQKAEKEARKTAAGTERKLPLPSWSIM